jgi:hypothetical protein
MYQWHGVRWQTLHSGAASNRDLLAHAHGSAGLNKLSRHPWHATCSCTVVSRAAVGRVVVYVTTIVDALNTLGRGATKAVAADAW